MTTRKRFNDPNPKTLTDTLIVYFIVFLYIAVPSIIGLLILYGVDSIFYK